MRRLCISDILDIEKILNDNMETAGSGWVEMGANFSRWKEDYIEESQTDGVLLWD